MVVVVTGEPDDFGRRGKDARNIAKVTAGRGMIEVVVYILHDPLTLGASPTFACDYVGRHASQPFGCRRSQHRSGR